MREHNKRERESLVRRWRGVFERILGGAPPGGRDMPIHFDLALNDIYGVPSPGPDPPGSSVDPKDNCF
jgi:hypothetical protein